MNVSNHSWKQYQNGSYRSKKCTVCNYEVALTDNVSLKGFTWQILLDRINIGTAYSTNTTGVRFTFKSYNLDTKKWIALSNEKISNWQTWYPEQGNYWIYVEATLPNGYKTNQVMCFAVGRNY